MPMSPLPLALRLGLAAGLAAAPISAQQTVALHPKALRNWDLVLPAPAQREVAGGIAVAHGGTFAAQTEGELLRADLDGDGVMEAQVEGETGFLTLRSAGADGAEYRYSVRLERRPMQPWTWTTGGGMAGELDGTPILFLDQNLDGDYADFGEDAMVIGQDHAASFLSRVISVNGSLFTIELAADGSTLQYAPFEGPSGTLDLLESFAAKAKLDAAVVVNADATLSFSLARARGGLVVPAGEYRLHSGRLALGDSRAVIGAGASKPILVAAGQRAAPAWGGPVRAEFAVQRSGDSLSFAPWDIWFYGSLGEEYANFLPLGESPLFTVKERVTGEPLVYARFPGNC
jgi:hypothetical protein